jgi:hypothetical protein
LDQGQESREIRGDTITTAALPDTCSFFSSGSASSEGSPATFPWRRRAESPPPIACAAVSSTRRKTRASGSPASLSSAPRLAVPRAHRPPAGRGHGHRRRPRWRGLRRPVALQRWSHEGERLHQWSRRRRRLSRRVARPEVWRRRSAPQHPAARRGPPSPHRERQAAQRLGSPAGGRWPRPCGRVSRVLVLLPRGLSRLERLVGGAPARTCSHRRASARF